MRAMIVVLALAASGCASLNSEATLQAMQNLQNCDRTYTAALGMGASGTLNITCKARPAE